jgi:NAD(P)-dependent dehydrogenase (short-subunit alcohol dehydrogenase family)
LKLIRNIGIILLVAAAAVLAFQYALTWATLRAAVPHMKPGSAIINTASINSDKPNPTLLAYATTKGAIQNFTAGLAQLGFEVLPSAANFVFVSHPQHDAATLAAARLWRADPSS